MKFVETKKGWSTFLASGRQVVEQEEEDEEDEEGEWVELSTPESQIEPQEGQEPIPELPNDQAEDAERQETEEMRERPILKPLTRSVEEEAASQGPESREDNKTRGHTSSEVPVVERK